MWRKNNMDMFTSETENMIVGNTEQLKRIGVIEPENTINNEIKKFIYAQSTTLQKFKNWGIKLEEEIK